MGLNDADGARRIDRARDLVGGELLPALVTAIPHRSAPFRRSPDHDRRRQPLGDRSPHQSRRGAARGARSLSRPCPRGHRARHRRRRQRRRRRRGHRRGGCTGVCHRHRSALGPPRSRSRQRHRGGIRAERRDGGRRRHRRRARLRRRADRAAAARERPADRSAARQAGGRRRADQRDVPRLAESRRADGLHRRDPLRGRRARRPRTTRAARWCRRRGVRGASCSCRGRPASSTAFSAARWSPIAASRVDSVARKGRDDSGAETFYVQASQSRADALLGGYPNTRDALFVYDVVVLANVDPDLLTTPAARADPCVRRGTRRRPARARRARVPAPGTPRYDARGRAAAGAGRSSGGGIVQASASPGRNRVALTPAGQDHPGHAARRRTRRERRSAGPRSLRWRAISPLGGARPGATVLAVTGGPGGSPRALVAVQRFGGRPIDGVHGRSVVALAHDVADFGRSVLRAVLAAGRALARAERARAGDADAAGRSRRRATASR